MTKINLLLTALVALVMTSFTSNDSKNKGQQDTTHSITSLEVAKAPTLAELQKDPDVLWIAEVMVDYAPNFNTWTSTRRKREVMKYVGFKGRMGAKTLKYQVTDFDKSDDKDHLLGTKLLNNKESLKLYKDDNLSEVLSAEELKNACLSLDTIITFDPQNFEEVVQVVEGSIDSKDINFFKMKQLVYYSKKDITFKAIPLAIAPMANHYDENKKYLGSKPVFWMEVGFMEELPDLSSEDITWAKRVHRRFDVKDVKVLKEGKGFGNTIETFMEDVRANPNKVYVAHTFDADGNQRMTKEELLHLGASVDTIITFDPKTKEEIKQVIMNVLSGDDVMGIRLMQDWVWNETSRKMIVHYTGFKPIISRFDDKGNFLNSGPMLTRRHEKDTK